MSSGHCAKAFAWLRRQVLFDYLGQLRLLVPVGGDDRKLCTWALMLLYWVEALRCLVLAYKASLCDVDWLYHDPMVTLINQRRTFGPAAFVCFAGFSSLTAIVVYLLKFALPRTWPACEVLRNLLIDDLEQLGPTIRFGQAWRFVWSPRTLPPSVHPMSSYPALSQVNHNRLVRFMLFLKITFEWVVLFNLCIYLYVYALFFVLGVRSTYSWAAMVWMVVDLISVFYISIKMVHFCTLALGSCLVCLLATTLMLGQLNQVLANFDRRVSVLASAVFRHYHREHVRCVRHLRVDNERLWSRFTLIVLLVNVPINLYFVSYLYNHTFTYVSLVLVMCSFCQVFFCALGYTPMGHLSARMHSSARHLPLLQIAMGAESSSRPAVAAQVRLARYFELVSSDSKLGVTVGASLATITYLNIFVFVLNYAVYITQTFNVFAL